MIRSLESCSMMARTLSAAGDICIARASPALSCKVPLVHAHLRLLPTNCVSRHPSGKNKEFYTFFLPATMSWVNIFHTVSSPFHKNDKIEIMSTGNFSEISSSSCFSTPTKTISSSWKKGINRVQNSAWNLQMSGVPKLYASHFENVLSGRTFFRTIRTLCHHQNDKFRQIPEEEYSMNGEDAENLEEWIHPDQRSDTVLEKDPELKSLLRELASDFGRENNKKNSLHESHTNEENKQCQQKSKADMYRTDDIEAFEPVKTDSGKLTIEKNFVFSIDDLVSILREENAQDICVIKIPEEKQYVDFFVVMTGRSPRHIRAMAQHINKKYKAKKTKEDPFVLVEGEQTDDWMCIDFGNIVLHLMSEEMREFYELEKLWTLGSKYDDQLKRMKEYDEKMSEVLSTDMEERASTEEKAVDSPTITLAR